MESKVMHRTTITMSRPPIRYNLILYAVQTGTFRFNLKRKYYLLDVVRDTDTPTNRYVLTGDVGAPYEVIHVLPVYDEQDITELENTLKKMKDTIEVKYLQVMQTVIGEWGYRRIDNTITRQYRIIESLNK